MSLEQRLFRAERTQEVSESLEARLGESKTKVLVSLAASLHSAGMIYASTHPKNIPLLMLTDTILSGISAAIHELGYEQGEIEAILRAFDGDKKQATEELRALIEANRKKGES